MKTVDWLVSKAPDGWHEINLGRCVAECHKQVSVRQLSNKARLVKSRYQYCSTGYVMSRAGAAFLRAKYNSGLGCSNDQLKTGEFERGSYRQYSITPRLVQADARCGVNGCTTEPECGPAVDQPLAPDANMTWLLSPG